MAAIEILVKAGPRSYSACPLKLAMPADRTLPEGSLRLVSSAGATIPAQLVQATSGPELHWIQPTLAPGEEQRLTLLAANQPAAADAGVQLTTDLVAATCAVKIGGAPFTSYYHGSQWYRPFLHPLIGPYGAVTRRWPMEPDSGEKADHKHHKGCWVAWGDVNGADNWSDEARAAKVRHGELLASESGPVLGRLVAHNTWLAADGQPALTEMREYRFFRTPASARLFELRVNFQATHGAVRFGDTKEGGICSVRVATSMDASGSGVITNAFGGTQEGETWGKRAPWCDYTGPVAGKLCGITIMDNPANYCHPTYWHVRNYGLMTANPFGLAHFLNDPERNGSLTLAAGATLTFNYRVLIHAGDCASARVADQYHHYINPPASKLV